jgi:site-specific recombinase XerD
MVADMTLLIRDLDIVRWRYRIGYHCGVATMGPTKTDHVISPARLAVADITKDSMRTAFASYARDHEAASIRRCWSTWNVLCTFLYTGELLTANPMQLVGRPNLAKPLPKALPRTAVEALLETVAHDQDRSAKPTGPSAISQSS